MGESVVGDSQPATSNDALCTVRRDLRPVPATRPVRVRIEPYRERIAIYVGCKYTYLLSFLPFLPSLTNRVIDARNQHGPDRIRTLRRISLQGHSPENPFHLRLLGDDAPTLLRARN